MNTPDKFEPLCADSCSASDDVRRMVFAFDDKERQDEARRVVNRVQALEDALLAMREYYREHMITGTLYKQVEAALGLLPPRGKIEK